MLNLEEGCLWTACLAGQYSSISERHPDDPRWPLGSRSTMTTAEKVAHEYRNTTAVLTGIEANKSPRNCAGSQTSTVLGNEGAGFKNLKVLRG